MLVRRNSRPSSLCLSYETASDGGIETESFFGKHSIVTRDTSSEELGRSFSVTPYLKDKLSQKRRERTKLQNALKQSRLPFASYPISVADLSSSSSTHTSAPSLSRHCKKLKRAQLSKELRKRFIRAVQMVCVIIRMCISIRSDRKSKDREMTVEELHYYSMKEQEFSSKSRTLHFNRADYSRSNRLLMPLWARHFMQLSPEERSLGDAKRLLILLKDLKAFKYKFSPEAQLEFCQHCIYGNYHERQIVVKRGHPGEFFYIIFSGSVFVNIQEVDKQGKTFTKTDCVLTEGTLFGEVSLFHDMPRSASIVCREKTECIMIDGHVLRRICPDRMNRETIHKLHTMRSCDLFTDWPDSITEQLCKHSKIEEYGYNKVVEEDTLRSEFIYIVSSGRVEVLISIVPQYNSRASLLPDSDILQDYLPGMRDPLGWVMSKSQVARGMVSPHRVFIKVDILGPKDYCDIVTLNREAGARGLILVSFGATVVRIPKQQIISMAPLNAWRTIQNKMKNAKRYPPMAVLNRAFLEKHQWKLFKHLTVADALERQDGCLYANKAATSKGTSGASVFPGMRFCSPPEPNNVECILCRAGIELSEIEEKASRNHLPRLTK